MLEKIYFFKVAGVDYYIIHSCEEYTDKILELLQKLAVDYKWKFSYKLYIVVIYPSGLVDRYLPDTNMLTLYKFKHLKPKNVKNNS
jgi:hypothetical protein